MQFLLQKFWIEKGHLRKYLIYEFPLNKYVLHFLINSWQSFKIQLKTLWPKDHFVSTPIL